jgi:MFS family permease
MAMVGKPLAGRISDRVGRKPVILFGMALCAASLPLFPLTTHPGALLLEGAIFGLGMAIVTPSTTALVADLCKAGNHGAAMGVFGTIWDIGEAAGPILAGVIIFTLGNLDAAPAYLWAFTIIAGVLALAGVAFGVTVRTPGLAVERV